MNLRNRIQRLLAPPEFPGDEGKTAVARHLNTMTWLVIAMLLVYSGTFAAAAPHLRVRLALIPPLLALQAVVLAAMRRGHIRLASTLSLAGFWVVLGISTAWSGGIRSAPYSGNIVVILTAALLLGWPTAVGAAGLTLLEGLLLIWAEGQGLLPPLSTTPTSAWLLQAVFLIVGAGSLH